MKNLTVKAFTILEITITMLVAGLLIGITYTTYSIVLKSYHSFKEKNDRMAIVISLDHALKRDFYKADTIFKDVNGIAMKKDTQLVRYLFYPEFILRQTVKTDTFKVQTQDWLTLFDKIPLNEVDVTSEQNRLDELNFIIILENEKIPYHYQKQYSSENLINRNANAVN